MRALITGINGQDGSYLAELLLREKMEVHGTIRRASLPNLQRIEHLRDRLTLHWADLSDSASLFDAVRLSEPDMVFNLGAQSDVRVSYDIPEYVGNVTGLGVTRLLEAVRQIRPDARFYQAGSSEMFGMNPAIPCDEKSSFMPGSPYAAAKVYAHHIVRNYRESYNMHASNGILFNHESERRGVEFVTRKITLGIRAIKDGKIKKLKLGNLGAQRDWGYAPDFVEGILAIVKHKEPDDYVLATGETYPVRTFLDVAFQHAGMDWREYVTIDASLFRPEDPPVLLGDASKAKAQLSWKPTVHFVELVERMVDHDLEEK